MNSTEKDLLAKRKYEALVMQHNGNVAYLCWVGLVRDKPIRITSITHPLNTIPSEIGFIDINLIGIKASNDENDENDLLHKSFKSLPQLEVKSVKSVLKVVK